MSETTTDTRLDRIQAIYRDEIPAKRAELEGLHREGEELIRAERADGSTAPPLARASGLSPQRIYQIGGPDPQPAPADDRGGRHDGSNGTADDTARGDRPREWPIEVRPSGTILFDGIAIGGLDLTEPPAGTPVTVTDWPRLTLNAGWIRLAGLRFRVQDDPECDSHRDGLVLDR